MDRAAKKYPGSMAAVMGVSRETLADILAPLSQEGPIGAANYNTPEQTVISGVRDLVERASQRVAQAGGKALPLAVSGAWHSPLMGEAMEAFQAVLQAVPFQAPRCPVFLNVTGGQEKDPAKIKAVMSRQMGSPVFWVDLVNRMPELGISQYLEVGPKKVLLGLLKKCLPKDAAYQAFNVEDQKSLEAFLAANPG
jgi:[acyl-carrier-protein] S-malonyltransferase